MKKRLQTVLAHAGIDSRRGVVKLIESGKVKIDGIIVKEKGFRVDPDEQNIQVNGREILKEQKYYFIFNKPKNVISTVKDTHDRKKVTDFFSDINARLYPVGRLDRDTTGLLIVTNDGELAHGLMHPKFEIEKEYVATVKPCVDKKDIKKLEKGVELDNKKTAACIIRLEERDLESAVYRIILHEGKNRHIRRMFEEVNVKVIKLKRVKYAGLDIKGVRSGESRPLTKEEVCNLKNAIG
ncbi:MAG: rRNA pseudouridine synthase [Candidatus Omnitrophica bacterium]|nr:rRNA pseudouridine synthase [Candidatus Omnitrophota bacterium]